MKKFVALLMTLMLAFTLTAFADEAAAVQVYVSITDDTGALVLAHEAIDVTDADADGALTINDALICAHAARHEEGAAAYRSEASEFGLSLMKLWGVENGGSYGYCLNDASAWSLLDPVAAGDHVKAYAFTDLVAWSDTYSFFDAAAVEAAAGAEVALTLYAAGFDEMWNPVTLNVEGAVITVNGEATDVATDAQGKAVMTFAEAGVYVISADSETMNLVAPVCVVTVTAE